MSSAEKDFFAATDFEGRADAFTEIDPHAASARLLGPLLGGLAVLGALIVFVLMPASVPGEAPPGPTSHVAAAPAEVAVLPVATPPAETAKAPATGRPMMRLGRGPSAAAVAAVASQPSSGGETSTETGSPSGSGAARPQAPAGEIPAQAGEIPMPAVLPPVVEVSVALSDEPLPSPWLQRRLRGAAVEGVAADTAGAEVAARVALKAGRFAEALHVLEGLPASAGVDAMRGRALFELGRDADARAMLERAHDAAPTHAETLLLLGTVRQAAADRDGARAAYRAFLAANPQSPHARDVRRIIDSI